MELYKAVISGNVDVKEGIIFVKAGLFYSEEVKNKYPYMFEVINDKIEEVVEVKNVDEVIETNEPLVIEPTEVVVAPAIVEEVQEVAIEQVVVETVATVVEPVVSVKNKK